MSGLARAPEAQYQDNVIKAYTMYAQDQLDKVMQAQKDAYNTQAVARNQQVLALSTKRGRADTVGSTLLDPAQLDHMSLI
jgi:hypothetical protein